ncbi:hypothetical protein [Amycolatopsis minnesotensis]|uniref:hypothetical protein n=1 Tax=Amycolatopsis minnesotensis TaxID=337894 RepID=UPI0031CEBAD5
MLSRSGYGGRLARPGFAGDVSRKLALCRTRTATAVGTLAGMSENGRGGRTAAPRGRTAGRLAGELDGVPGRAVGGVRSDRAGRAVRHHGPAHRAAVGRWAATGPVREHLPGDHTADAGPAAFTTTTESVLLITGADVRRTGQAVAVLGDSITEDYGLPLDTNGSWTDVLARWLARARRDDHLAHDPGAPPGVVVTG